jgi:hypothetical protein
VTYYVYSLIKSWSIFLSISLQKIIKACLIVFEIVHAVAIPALRDFSRIAVSLRENVVFLIVDVAMATGDRPVLQDVRAAVIALRNAVGSSKENGRGAGADALDQVGIEIWRGIRFI